MSIAFAEAKIFACAFVMVSGTTNLPLNIHRIYLKSYLLYANYIKHATPLYTIICLTTHATSQFIYIHALVVH
jgi:hypothetical protein